jgi:hypothetical protein
LSLLLAIGGCYWWGKANKLKGKGQLLQATLTWADRLQFPLLVSLVLLSVLCAVGTFYLHLFHSSCDAIIAATALVFAAIEYINYYHRQIQHFDHLADFQRLVGGAGFRKSQLAKDLARFRHRRELSG